ncbi:type I-E CRISPR-associated protein Cse1/CasA [Thermus hydrothermalis]|uniref:type I-E CRISPR-associated protein Cse1/CasA n=1 Tax=Thermus hydrothermalis TaxID=2908148 RepID=UPI001FAB12D8
MEKFNLLEEPWIPVLEGGQVREVSLREALLQAHRITRIETASPLEEAALHRLLLAILHRALPPVKDALDGADLLDRGAFDHGALEAYLDQYHGRFWLFHPQAPFFQIADLPVEDVLPWTKLRPELASGNNPTLFDHTTDQDPPEISYAEAARALVVHQSFALGGLLKRLGVTAGKDAPLARPAVFLPTGDTLFETLVLNLVPYDPKGDAPFWENPPLRRRDVENAATKWPLSGITRVYTWPSRGVLLLDGGKGVRWMAYGPGVEPDAVAFRDPMAAYRLDAKGNIFPLRLSEEKSFWRDFSAMLPAQGGTPPATLLHAIGVREETGRKYRLRVLGQVSDQAKVLDVRREVYPLPSAILHERGALALVTALRLAEDLGKGLTSVAWQVARGVLGDKDASELEAFVRSLPLLPSYWASLDLAFLEFLDALGEPHALEAWREELRRAALRAFEATRLFVGTGGRHLAALAAGERALAMVLGALKEVKA